MLALILGSEPSPASTLIEVIEVDSFGEFTVATSSFVTVIANDSAGKSYHQPASVLSTTIPYIAIVTDKLTSDATFLLTIATRLVAPKVPALAAISRSVLAAWPGSLQPFDPI